VDGELVAEDRQQRHVTHAGIGLRSGDVQPAAGEIDVAPAQGHELTDPQAGECQRREQCAPRDVRAVVARFAVELPGGVEQSADLRGVVEIGATGTRGLELGGLRVPRDLVRRRPAACPIGGGWPVRIVPAYRSRAAVVVNGSVVVDSTD